MKQETLDNQPVLLRLLHLLLSSPLLLRFITNVTMVKITLCNKCHNDKDYVL